MGSKYRLIPLDFVTVGLTLLGTLLHFIAFFAGPWWKHEGQQGSSYFGMINFRMCEVGCKEKSVLDIDGGTEWIFAVRVFEAFGVICLLLAVVLLVPLLIVRKKIVHTSLIYLLGAGALFILVGFFIFIGCKANLDKKVDGDSSLTYAFALCLLGALTCIAAAVVGGFTLRKHLLDLDYDDDVDNDGGDSIEYLGGEKHN